METERDIYPIEEQIADVEEDLADALQRREDVCAAYEAAWQALLTGLTRVVSDIARYERRLCELRAALAGAEVAPHEETSVAGMSAPRAKEARRNVQTPERHKGEVSMSRVHASHRTDFLNLRVLTEDQRIVVDVEIEAKDVLGFLSSSCTDCQYYTLADIRATGGDAAEEA